MEITEKELTRAEAAMEVRRRRGHATAARYDTSSGRLVVSLHNGVELAVPVRLIEGLADADPASLSEVEITPAGLGLHWSALDADVSVPGLLDGVFGSRSWMAAQLGGLWRANQYPRQGRRRPRQWAQGRAACETQDGLIRPRPPLPHGGNQYS